MAKMKLNVQQQGDTIFRLFVQQSELLLDSLEGDLEAQIERMLVSGMDPAEVLVALEASLDNATDSFGSLRAAINGDLDDITGSISQITSQDMQGSGEELYTWELDPTAKEHCGDCVERSQEPAQTLAEWEAIGLPGIGNTECDGYCKCTLVPEGVRTNDGGAQ